MPVAGSRSELVTPRAGVRASSAATVGNAPVISSRGVRLDPTELSWVVWAGVALKVDVWALVEGTRVAEGR